LRANVGLGSGDDKSDAGPWLEGQNLMEIEHHEREMIGTSFQPTIPPIIYSQPETFGDKLDVASSFTSDAALDFDAYHTPALHQWPLQPAEETVNRWSFDQWPFDQYLHSFVLCALIT